MSFLHKCPRTSYVPTKVSVQLARPVVPQHDTNIQNDKYHPVSTDAHVNKGCIQALVKGSHLKNNFCK